MGTIDDIVDNLLAAISDHFQKKWPDVKDAALSDAKAFMEKCKTDISRWTRMRLNGELTPEEVEWLLKGKEDLVEVVALTKAGLKQQKKKKFIEDLFLTIATCAIKAI